ncbi:uncharacterized protein NECHADRAFT_76074 [Fusarium vanettenii 77-13-4]|uniref:DUF6546 domain-containing protein n=1 Tax=Fusarium vanettenii (strain ATCC MYA-4622 / CBS 123669 / FGSC 9596 / NRRL 45880 / 77-13-4) TaxID=660122 RepID=C7Z6E5_FUSV7|nr:uncharacterized protein NECHADRAFT_76074 [Fusarium vanettenii 77-13-4]EEU40677.1 hypothetical protein NECHADRAFT_76074 [Fusarium vanettenii 77-13-4]
MPCVTRSMARRPSKKNVFPPEIQLYILEWLMTPHNTSKDRLARPSNFACVCKSWQRIVEKSTFRRISLRPACISRFERLVGPASSRRGYVKHVLLEIPVGEYDHEPCSHFNNYIFTLGVSHLWKFLATWQNYSLTVELGIFSSFETRMHNLDLPDRQLPECILGNPRIDHASRFEDPPWDPGFMDLWKWQKRSYLGSRALQFQFGEHHSLPSAPVITRLLVRRQYFRNISPKAFADIFNAAPCLEVIHLERWCYNWMLSDKEWDRGSSLIGLHLPSSLKQFSFYDECSTTYHRQGRMRLPRSNKRLLRSLIENKWSNQLKHLSISFAFDAQEFFSPHVSHNWASLATLALTSNLVLTRSSDVVNELLVKVGEAAKHMPKLGILEIWNCEARNRKAGIFRYEKLDRAGKIVWQGTWDLEMSSQVKRAWQEVLVAPDGGHYELSVEVMSIQPRRLVNLGSIYPYLKLRRHVLDGISWTQAGQWTEKLSPRLKRNRRSGNRSDWCTFMPLGLGREL